MEAGNTLLDDHVLSLTGVARPKVCFIPTASGDADHYVVRFYREFAAKAEVSHLSLFRRDRGAGAVEGDIESHLMEQDLIYVGGGSVLSLLGTWRAHGVDTMIERAWRSGVMLCGLSAGSLCWFDEAQTAFHGPPERVQGMGLLPWSNCVHYDAEPERAIEFKEAIASGQIGPGYGADDGAALHFVGSELAEVISSRPKSRAFHVTAENGEAVETQLPVRYLGVPKVALAA